MGPQTFSNCQDANTAADQIGCFSNGGPPLDLLAPSYCARTTVAGGGYLDCFGGLFWFFNPVNPEMLVKVLDACVPPFDRFWVFFSAGTNVGLTVTVTDTQTGRVKTYSNPDGQAALPLQDTDAFPCAALGLGLPRSR